MRVSGPTEQMSVFFGARYIAKPKAERCTRSKEHTSLFCGPRYLNEVWFVFIPCFEAIYERTFRLFMVGRPTGLGHDGDGQRLMTGLTRR